MTNNDVFRRLRYALELSNPAMVEIFRLSGRDLVPPDFMAMFKKEGEEGYQECSDDVLEDFLDGLIALKRGQRPGEPVVAAQNGKQLANNDILKKIRIALELKEADMLSVLKLAGFPTSKSELSAIFRVKGHENYKECGDQLLRNFLKGLTLKYREDGPGKKSDKVGA